MEETKVEKDNIMYKVITEENKRMGFCMEVRKVIKDVKYKNYLRQREEVSKEGLSFFGNITGKNDLQLERMKNIKLKMELLEAEKDNYKFDTDEHQMLADLYSCALLELGGKLNTEMEAIYNKIKTYYMETTAEDIPDEVIYQIACNQIYNDKDTLPVVYNAKQKGLIFGSIKNQIAVYKMENARLMNQIVLQRGKNEIGNFSCSQYIIPDNVKNSKNNLTNG